MTRIIRFLFTSITTGLAAAFIVLLAKPDLMPLNEWANPTHPETIATLPNKPGPVSYSSAVNHAAPSVINVYATKVTRNEPHPLSNDPLFQQLFGDQLKFPSHRRENSLGSGVIINDKGYLLTNHHVISHANEIQVVLRDGRQFPAHIIGSDPETDLAVLKIPAKQLPVATFGNSQQLKIGDVVLAIGNPFGVGQTVTLGIVSATGRNQLGISDFENFIQTDAAINPGNSGGALINAFGEVVGINTAIFSKSGGSHGIGFAIPMQLAHEVMQQIIQQGRVIRGWIGVSGQNLTPLLAESLDIQYQRGILVSGVLTDGPADQAGIRPGDLLTQIDGQPIKGVVDMLNLIAGKKPGAMIKLTLQRQNQQHQVQVAVIERPSRA